FSLSTAPRPPDPALFPYTTLFRSASRKARPFRKATSSPCWSDAMSIELIRGLYDYHRWANHALFDIALARGDEAVEREMGPQWRSEEHTSELQSPYDLVCRLLLEK